MQASKELLHCTDFSFLNGSYFHSMTHDPSSELEKSLPPAAAPTDENAAIRDLAKDADATAAAFLSGNFAKDGIGKVGTAYRRLTALETGPENDLIEGWSDFLSALSELWEKKHKEACLEALKASQAHFNPPEEFSDRIAEHIEQAQAHIAFDKIETRFDEGDDEGAVGLIRLLPDDMQAEYAVYIKARAQQRKKSRFITFSIAGALCVVLGGFAINGAIGFKRLLDSPPSFALPEFTPPPFIEDIKSLRAEEVERRRATNANDTAPPTTATGDPFRNDEANQSTAIFDPVTKPEQSSDSLGEEVDVTTAPQVTSEKLYNCALAMAGAQSAADVVARIDNPDMAAKLTAFQEKLDAACKKSGITPGQLIPIVATLDQAEIEKISQGILSN